MHTRRYCLLLFAALLFFTPGICTEVRAEEPVIQVRMSDWNALKSELRGARADYEMLKAESEMLKLKSETLNRQLGIVETQLKTSQESLTKSETSLTKVQNDMTELMKSLTELKAIIKQEQHKKRVIERQRDTYAALAGIALCWAVTK